MSRRYRSMTYRKHWRRLTEMYGYLCYYCHEGPSESIDHVVPQSWDNDNSLENLVPACFWCNHLAADMIFDTIEDKTRYILKRRKQVGHERRCYCTDCLLPYVYLENSPTLFQCAECYDYENGTAESHKRSWRKWLRLLKRAEIRIEAHRSMIAKIREYGDIPVDRQHRVVTLHEEINKIIMREIEEAEQASFLRESTPVYHIGQTQE